MDMLKFNAGDIQAHTSVGLDSIIVGWQKGILN